MIFLDTNDKIQQTSSAAANLDTIVSYIDVVSGAGTLATQKKNHAAATTVDICDAPSSGARSVKTINIRNKHASVSTDVTVILNDNNTQYELAKFTLNPGEVLEYVEGIGWFKIPASTPQYINESTGQQGAGFSTDTYLTGSNITIPSGLPVVGTAYKLIFDVVKSAAGTATPIVTVRYGVNGTTGDTARLTFTFGAGTGVADTAVVEILAVFRTVGSGTTAVLQGQARAVTNLTTTGWSNAVKALQVTSGGFDSTPANSIIGTSYNGGASASHTVQLVRAELIP